MPTISSLRHLRLLGLALAAALLWGLIETAALWRTRRLRRLDQHG